MKITSDSETKKSSNILKNVKITTWFLALVFIGILSLEGISFSSLKT